MPDFKPDFYSILFKRKSQMVKTRNHELIGKYVTVLYDKMFPLYLISGERNFLIDSGVTARVSDFRKRISNALEQIAPNAGKDIHTLMLTHTHWDHTGAAYELQKTFGFDVMVSEYGSKLLQKEKVIHFINRLNQDYKKMVDDTSGTRFARLQEVKPLKEGDRVPVAEDAYFQVYETPGHTRCSMSYLLMPERILFPGDAVGVQEQNGGVKPLFLSSYKNYEDSLEKLIRLDAGIMCFAHNRWISGKDTVREHLESSLARTRMLKESILERLGEGKSVEEIAEALYLEEFPKPTLLGPKEALMINLEAMIKVIRKEFPQS